MNLAIPKTPRVRLPKHLKSFESRPCVICGTTPSVGAHFRLGSTGMGRKPDDDMVIGLCARHHAEQHACKKGEWGWWLDYLAVDKRLFVMVMRGFARSHYGSKS